MHDREIYRIHAAVFAALANPTRHELLHRLCERPRTPTELSELLEVSKPNVSQHLAVLRREGIVTRRRDGSRVLWSVVDPRLAQACTLIDEIIGRELAGKVHALERKDVDVPA
jgi:DNA-binding transcriptional ArsR family regulator